MKSIRKKSENLRKDLEETIQDFKVMGLDAEIKLGVYDIKTGLNVSINGNKSGWAASIIKLPVMIATLQETEKRRILLKEELLVDHRFTLEQTDYVSMIPQGAPISVGELLFYMIATSDNEATNMLVDRIGGPQKVNECARELGLKRTMLGHLLCPNVPRYTSGFNRDGSNITNPEDMAKLMRHLYEPSYSKLSSFVRRNSDIILSSTIPTFLKKGRFKDSKIKCKVGYISDPVNGEDIHEVGIIDNRLIVCLMANKVKQDYSLDCSRRVGGGLFNREIYGSSIYRSNIPDELDDIDLHFNPFRNSKIKQTPTVPKLYAKIMEIIGEHTQSD